MKGKNILLMSLMTVFLFALMGMANASSATVTVTLTPAASGEVRDVSGLYNASVTVGATATNITYMWIEAYSTETVNSSTGQTLCYRSAVDSENNTNHIDCQIQTQLYLMDGLRYTFTGRAQNGTGATGENFTADTNTLITVDNTAPQCTDNSGISSNDIVSPSASWSFTGGNATEGTIYFGAGNPRTLTKGSYTGRNLALSFSDNIPETTYQQVYATLTDGANQTTCPILNYISVEDTDTAKKGVIIADLMKDGGLFDGKVKFDPILVVALILIIYYTSKGKKRK